MANSVGRPPKEVVAKTRASLTQLEAVAAKAGQALETGEKPKRAARSPAKTAKSTNTAKGTSKLAAKSASPAPELGASLRKTAVKGATKLPRAEGKALSDKISQQLDEKKLAPKAGNKLVALSETAGKTTQVKATAAATKSVKKTVSKAPAAKALDAAETVSKTARKSATKAVSTGTGTAKATASKATVTAARNGGQGKLYTEGPALRAEARQKLDEMSQIPKAASAGVRRGFDELSHKADEALQSLQRRQDARLPSNSAHLRPSQDVEPDHDPDLEAPVKNGRSGLWAMGGLAAVALILAKIFSGRGAP